ncbi:replicative DNA helicase, partial [Patescibacteria group bacterium]
LKSLLTETFERIDELHKNKGVLRGVPTGYKDLDNLLAGFQQSNLLIIAARPSMGKTSMALDIARNVALNANIPVGIFSLEMSKEELVDRLLASESGVDLWKLRTGKLAEGGNVNDFDQLGAAMDKLSRSQIYIDDTPGANAMEIRTKARRLQAEHGLGLVIVDYLQLMEGTNRENRVQEVSEISRALKGIARELKVPVVALSQLSRAVEQRTPQIPQLSDLRESGSIEQDADVVMFIYREEIYKPETPRKRIAEIHVKKHRNGPTGIVELFFDANRVSFKNLDSQHGGNTGAQNASQEQNVASWTKQQAEPQQIVSAESLKDEESDDTETASPASSPESASPEITEPKAEPPEEEVST